MKPGSDLSLSLPPHHPHSCPIPLWRFVGWTAALMRQHGRTHDQINFSHRKHPSAYLSLAVLGPEASSFKHHRKTLWTSWSVMNLHFFLGVRSPKITSRHRSVWFISLTEIPSRNTALPRSPLETLGDRPAPALVVVVSHRHRHKNPLGSQPLLWTGWHHFSSCLRVGRPDFNEALLVTNSELVTLKSLFPNHLKIPLAIETWRILMNFSLKYCWVQTQLALTIWRNTGPIMGLEKPLGDFLLSEFLLFITLCCSKIVMNIQLDYIHEIPTSNHCNVWCHSDTSLHQFTFWLPAYLCFLQCLASR